MAVSAYWGVPTRALGTLTKEDIEARKIRDIPEDLASFFEDEDGALYEAGLCGVRVEYGMGGIGQWCGAPGLEECTVGYCESHHGEVCAD
jgi:hypothetical protein